MLDSPVHQVAAILCASDKQWAQGLRGMALQEAWTVTLVEVCGDLGVHSQEVEQTWAFPLVLLPHPQMGWCKRAKSTRLACWSAVLVDWACGILNGLGSWVGRGVRSLPGQHICQSLGP